jgi:hypothetical protein
LIYYDYEFKWKNGQLILIEKESQDYDDALELYIRINQKLQNGK